MQRRIGSTRGFVAWALLLALTACQSEVSTGDLAVTTSVSPANSAGEGVQFTLVEQKQMHDLAPPTLPAPPADSSNRYAGSPEAARLGQRLFFDTRFSGKLWEGDNDGSQNSLGVKGQTQKVSCAGCHLPRSGFSDSRSLGKQISLGASWGRRHAPSLLDVAQSRLFMWDGSRDSLQSQVFGPLESSVEMNSSRLFMALQAYQFYKPEYEALFGPMPNLNDRTKFPLLTAAQTGCQSTTVDAQPNCIGTLHGMPGDQAEFDRMSQTSQDSVTLVTMNLAKSIAAYERKLSCGSSRFDRLVRGDQNALSKSEKRGLKTFLNKGQCINCHAGPYFTDQMFHNVGLMATPVATVFVDANDRGAVLGLATALQDPLNVRGHFSDGDDGRLPTIVPLNAEGAFKTPSLRCSSQRPSYMHTGQLRTLADVIRFFSSGGDQYGYPGKSELHSLNLMPDEQSDLVNFLSSLDGTGPPEELLAPPPG